MEGGSRQSAGDAGGSGGGTGGGGGGGDRSVSEMSRSGRRLHSRDWVVRRGRHDSADETSIDCTLTEDDTSVRVLLKCMGFRVDEERKCYWWRGAGG